MKPTKQSCLLLVSTLITLTLTPALHAADGTWLGATGDWNVAGTWSGGTIADGTGFTANFTGADINSDQDITLGEDRTIGNITFTDATTPSNNLFIMGANTLTLDVASGVPEINVTQSDRTLFISSVITGTDGLLKIGDGTLDLSVVNSYSGGTTVNAGTLDLGVGGEAGAVRGGLTINTGGTVNTNAGDALGYVNGTNVSTLTNAGGTFNNAVANNQGFITNFNLTAGTVSSTGGGSINFNSGFGITTNASETTSNWSAPITIRGGTLGITTAQGSVPGDIDMAISGSIGQLGGTYGLAKNGAGTLAISTIATYGGGTTINAGTLALTNGGETGVIRGAVTINDGGTLRLAAGDATGYGANRINSITINSGGTLDVTTTGGDGQNQTLVGTISMTGSTISGVAGATIDLLGNGSNITTNASSTTSAIGVRLGLRQDDTIFTVADGDASVDLNVSGTMYDGIGGAGNNALIKAGAGLMEISAITSYTGGTTINDGTLALTNGGVTGAIRGAVTINDGGTLRLAAGDATGYGVNRINSITINSGGTLDVTTTGGDGQNQTLVGTISMTGSTISGVGGATIDLFQDGSDITTNASSTTSTIGVRLGLRHDDTTFTVADGDAPVDLNVSRAMYDGAGGEGNNALIKEGAGLMVISGTNTYTGNTSVNSGTLGLFGGSHTSPITVSSGAALGFAVGFPTTSTSTVTFDGATAKVAVAGTPAATTLMTASSITGTPVLEPAIPGFELAIEGGGTLLNLKATGSSAYTTWANGFPGFTPTTGTLDFDNDGIDNLLEFVLGGNPTLSDPGIAPSVNASGNDLVVTFNRTDLSETEPVTVKVQTSLDLVTWADFATIGAVSDIPSGYTVAENGAAADTIVVTIPKGTATKMFARVSAE